MAIDPPVFHIVVIIRAVAVQGGFAEAISEPWIVWQVKERAACGEESGISWRIREEVKIENEK